MPRLDTRRKKVTKLTTLTYLFIQVLPTSDSRWAIFSLTLGLVAALPKVVDGKTHRTDLPDNGFRFLPEDLEKVIPASLPLPFHSLDGDSKSLKSSFITLAVVLPIMGLLFGFFSWRRWKKDEELFDRMVQTHQSKQQMLDRSEKLTAQLENEHVAKEWTSVQIPEEKLPSSTQSNNQKVAEFNEKESYQNSEKLDDQNLKSQKPTHEPAIQNQYPHVVIPIDPQPPTVDLKMKSKEDTSISEKSPSPVEELNSKKPGDGYDSTQRQEVLDQFPGELQIDDDVRTTLSRKMTRDSIKLHFEKKRKKASLASVRSSI